MAAARSVEEKDQDLNRMASSFGISVKFISDNKGRGLFSNKNFKAGDLIFEENPVACAQFSWNTLYKYTACDHCMRSLETAQEMARRLSGNSDLQLPHPECCEIARSRASQVSCPRCQILYCSEKCRQDAEDQYHRILCLGHPGEDPYHPLTKLQETWGNMHYPPESASIMLIARIFASALQASQPEEVMESYKSFCHSVVNKEEHIAHKLLGKQFQEQLEILRVLVSNALYDEHLEKWFSSEGFQSLFGLIGMNGQGIGTSSLSVYVHNVDDSTSLSADERQAVDLFIDELYEEMDRVSGQFLNCEGSGLYTLQSCCNHSCTPNAEVTFPHNNSTLVLRATQDIEAGEEICICYLDECARSRSRHSRQRVLRENYLFSCTCAKCESQSTDPDVTSSEDEEEDEDHET